MIRSPVFVTVTVLVAFFAMALNAQELPKPLDPLAELRTPPKAPERASDVAKPAPKEDIRVRMLYDTDLATPYITSYNLKEGGLSTMQLSLVAKNGGRIIAPNGLYVFCWTIRDKSGAMFIDPISGDMTTVTPLQGSFQLLFGRAQKPDFSPPKKPTQP